MDRERVQLESEWEGGTEKGEHLKQSRDKRVNDPVVFVNKCSDSFRVGCIPPYTSMTFVFSP